MTRDLLVIIDRGGRVKTAKSKEELFKGLGLEASAESYWGDEGFFAWLG